MLNKKKDMFAIKMTTWSSHLFKRWFRQGLSGARGLRPKTWPRLSVTDSFQARERMFRGGPLYPSQYLPQVYYCFRGHSGPTLLDAVHVLYKVFQRGRWNPMSLLNASNLNNPVLASPLCFHTRFIIKLTAPHQFVVKNQIKHENWIQSMLLNPNPTR